jgi:hypothetical protein
VFSASSSFDEASLPPAFGSFNVSVRVDPIDSGRAASSVTSSPGFIIGMTARAIVVNVAAVVIATVVLRRKGGRDNGSSDRTREEDLPDVEADLRSPVSVFS